MKSSRFAVLVGSAAALCLMPSMTQEVSAFQLGSQWSYSMDAIGDGSGGDVFDIRGMAMSIQGNKFVVAITGNTPLTGATWSRAADKNIGYGDLFFNFSGKNFTQAQGDLFAIRFAGTNDTNVSMGVYSGVTTTSVTSQNDGWNKLNDYYDYGKKKNKPGVFDKENTQGDNGLSTREDVLSYFDGNKAIQTSIGAGTKVGDVTMLTAGLLKDSGLDFGKATGNHVFGFSFDRSLLPEGSFMANFFLECGNDGLAMSAEAVPEPATMAGTALGLAVFGGLRKARRRKEQVAD